MLYGTIEHLFGWQDLMESYGQIYSIPNEVKTTYLLNDLMINCMVLQNGIMGVKPEFMDKAIDIPITPEAIGEFIPSLFISWIGLCVSLGISSNDMKDQIERNLNAPTYSDGPTDWHVTRSGNEVRDLIRWEQRRSQTKEFSTFNLKGNSNFLAHTIAKMMIHVQAIRKEMASLNKQCAIMAYAAAIFQRLADMCYYAGINSNDVIELIRDEWRSQSYNYSQALFKYK